jgi:hypothetical protein
MKITAESIARAESTSSLTIGARPAAAFVSERD